MVDIQDIALTRQYGHIPSAQVVRIENIDISATGDTTIHTTPASKLFIVYQLFLVNQDASYVAFVAKSGSTTIGTYRIEATSNLDLWNSGLPVLVGRAVGEAFVLNASTASPVLTGHAAVGFMDAF